MSLSNNQDTVCVIKPDGTVNVSAMENGIKKTKVVSLEAFSTVMRSDEESFELPLLPTGIKKYRVEGEYTVVAMEYPDRIIENFNYLDRNYSIPVPRSVWISLLSNKGGSENYKVHKTWPFALDMPLLSESQNMYKWPFTNWSMGYGNICWGNDKAASDLNKGCKIANLSSLYSIYFNARANDHLGWDCRFEGDDWNNGCHAAFLDGKSNFDVSWLVSEGFTFNSAIEQILGGRRR